MGEMWKTSFERLYFSSEKKEGENNVLEAIAYGSPNIKSKNKGRMFLLFFSLFGHTLRVPCRSLFLQQSSYRQQRI